MATGAFSIKFKSKEKFWLYWIKKTFRALEILPFLLEIHF